MINSIRASARRIWALVKKEFITLLLDKSTRTILIVPVLVQSILFGYGATFNLENVPWTYCDESRSALSTELIHAINEAGTFRLTKPAESLSNLSESIARGDALAAVYLPSDFERTGRILVVTDARNSTTANVATGYLSLIVAELNRRHGNTPPVQLVERFRFNENTLTRWNIMPGLILALSLLQTLLLSALTVSREREEGSFDMLLMTPASSWEIYLGKGLPAIAVALTQAMVIFSVCRFWFGIPFAGSFPLLFFVIVLFASSVVGLGLAISAIAGSIQQSLVLSFLVVLPTIILSGLMTPVAAMPPLLQTLTMGNPMRFAIEAVRRIYFEGASLQDIAPLLIPIVLLWVVMTPLALRLFRQRLG